jgi:translation initiation factor IF-2
MAKKRVHEIAKAQGLSTKELLAALNAAGIEAKAAASSVDEELALTALGSNGAGKNATATKLKASPPKTTEAKAQPAKPRSAETPPAEKPARKPAAEPASAAAQPQAAVAAPEPLGAAVAEAETSPAEQILE